MSMADLGGLWPWRDNPPDGGMVVGDPADGVRGTPVGTDGNHPAAGLAADPRIRRWYALGAAARRRSKPEADGGPAPAPTAPPAAAAAVAAPEDLAAADQP